MKQLSLLAGLLALLVVPSVSPAMWSGTRQPLYHDLRMSARIDDYPGDVYVEPPSLGVDWVVIQGEPVVITTLISSSAQSTRSLVFSDGLSLAMIWRRQAWLNGRPVEIALSTPEVTGISSDGSVFEVSSDRVSLKPRDVIKWRMRVTSRLERGSYRILWTPEARDNGSFRPDALRDEMKFEVRGAEGLELELIRRSAMRAYMSGDRAGARSLISKMFLIEPNAYGAHMLLAMIEEREGDEQRAYALRQQALDVVERGADRLLVQKRPPHEISAILKGRRPQP